MMVYAYIVLMIKNGKRVWYAEKIYISPSDQVGNLYAVGNTNEAIQCRRIALATVEALKRCGFEAITNMTDGGNAMYERVAESNRWNADAHVCIHTNAFIGKVSGFRAFYYAKNGTGQRLCEAIMATVAPITPGTSDNVTPKPEFYEVNSTDAPCAYLELGFHDNPVEAQYIIDHTVELAEAICKGICVFYGEEYIPPVQTLYRVQVGAFAVRENAEAMLEEVKAAGFPDAYITSL